VWSKLKCFWTLLLSCSFYLNKLLNSFTILILIKVYLTSSFFSYNCFDLKQSMGKKKVRWILNQGKAPKTFFLKKEMV
jgi:hypothetical protein